MLKFAVKRILLAILTLLGASALTFALGRLAPGDPVDILLAGIANPGLQEIELARLYLQLDQPLAVQYISWLTRVLHGDFGNSYSSGFPVMQEITLRLPATLRLTLASVLVMLLTSFPLGIIAALKQNTITDYTFRFFNSLLIAVPTFCFGILLIIIFAQNLGWLPVLPTGNLNQLILPAVTVGLGSGAGLARLVRSQVIVEKQREHVHAALAFGVSGRKVFVNNVLKNAMPPLITNIGLFTGALLGGSAIIETLFSWPGVGRYAVEAIFGRDYPVIQAYALIMAVIYIVINLLIDLLNCLFAPSANILGVQAVD